jgi:hypothetical protein
MASDEEVDRFYECAYAMGFAPGGTIECIQTGFTREDLARSLFESSFDHPVPVIVKTKRADLPVVVVRVEVRIGTDGFYAGVIARDGRNFSDWFVVGWQLKPGYDSVEDVDWLQMYVATNPRTGDFDDITLIQRVPKKPDPNGITTMAH